MREVICGNFFQKMLPIFYVKKMGKYNVPIYIMCNMKI